MSEPGRVSDELLSEFIIEQREYNRISELRFDGLESVVIGPKILGTTGAEILNGDGLAVRDKSGGLAAQKRTLSRPMRFAILSAAAVVVAAGIPDLLERLFG